MMININDHCDAAMNEIGNGSLMLRVHDQDPYVPGLVSIWNTRVYNQYWPLPYNIMYCEGVVPC